MKKTLLAITILTIALLFPSYSQAATTSSPHADWHVTVDGAVQTPLNLTIADLANMPQTTVQTSIYCYGAFVTGGNWTGVQLSYLLELAGVEQNLEFSVNFKASDGYTIYGFPESAVSRSDVIIAYQKDGAPLDEVLRLVVPGVNGNVWVSIITQVTVKAIPGSSLEALTPPLSGSAAGLPKGPSSLQPAQKSPQEESQPQPSQNTTAVTSPQSEQNQTVPEAVDAQQSSPAQQQGLSTPAQGLPYGYLLIALAAVLITVGSSATYLMVKKKRTSCKP